MIRAALLGLCMALVATAAGAAPRFTTAYDSHFREASATHLPARDWLLLKAQGIQESGLDPEAISPAGAAGVMQFMPATWREEATRLGYTGVPRSVARASIFAGASYLSRLIDFWSPNGRTAIDRDMLALACYNAGCGNLLAAQRASGGAMDYDTILAALPSVTGHHARETQGYAPGVYRWRDRLAAGRA